MRLLANAAKDLGWGWAQRRRPRRSGRSRRQGARDSGLCDAVAARLLGPVQGGVSRGHEAIAGRGIVRIVGGADAGSDPRAC
jgi:hypothetical protein